MNEYNLKYIRRRLKSFVISDNKKERKMPEEFEHDLIGVLQKHFGENFDYNWDSENPIVALDLETNKKGGFYIRLRVWGDEND